MDYSLAPVAHVDLLGATGDDGSPLVTLEAPDTNDLDIDPVESREGKLIARCALVRVRNDAHATVRNLIIDGRHQGWVLRRTGAEIEFKSVTTDNADTIIDHVETRNFDSTEAVRLLDSSGHLRTTYPTIQEAINAAAEGDEIVIAAAMGSPSRATSTWSALWAPRRRSPSATRASKAGIRRPASTPEAQIRSLQPPYRPPRRPLPARKAQRPSSPDPDPSGLFTAQPTQVRLRRFFCLTAVSALEPRARPGLISGQWPCSPSAHDDATVFAPPLE